MNRTEKQQLCKELHEVFLHHPHALVVDFTGINVNDVSALRRKLRDANCHYQVVKNTFARIAAKDTPMAGLMNYFQGTTAIAYHPTDPILLAKIFTEFAKDNKNLSFKGILLDGQPLPGSELDAVATMPGKPELISKLLFLLNYPLTALVRVLNAPMRDMAVVLGEIKKEETQPAVTN